MVCLGSPKAVIITIVTGLLGVLVLSSFKFVRLLPDLQQQQYESLRYFSALAERNSTTIDRPTNATPVPPLTRGNNSHEEAVPSLPEWVQSYVDWHRSIRRQFPDTQLLPLPQDGPPADAPNLLVVVCIQDCGGLYDRLNSLLRWMMVAHQSRRVLLYKWYTVDLETFLVPNEINWTAPLVHPLLDESKVTVSATQWWKQFRQSKQDHEPKVVTGQRPPINEKEYQQLLSEVGDSNHDPTTVFSQIFHQFFRPSDALQQMIEAEQRSLQLVPGRYVAVHCRVRHPGKFGLWVQIPGKVNGTVADESGLPWSGTNRDSALSSASRALQCVNQLAVENEPIFLYSDSEDLIHHVQNDTLLHSRTSGNLAENAMIQKVKDQRSVVSRSMQRPVIHIDRHKSNDPSGYFDSFLDLYLAASARCISTGIGNFAYLAAKISGNTKCLQNYERIRKKAGKIWHQNTEGEPCLL